MPETALAVDIGGTKIAAALIDVEGIIRERATAPTPALDGGQAVLDAVVALAIPLLQSAARPVRRIGVGTAGVVDVTTGRIVSSTDTFTDWAGTDIPGGLRARLGAEFDSAVIAVHNDVNAHALGELRFGAARGASDALVVAVGTGIGAGLIIDGQVYSGPRSHAGEIAHLPIPGAEAVRCPCGRYGHLEAIGSGAGIVRLFRQLGGTADDAPAVVALATSGDALAERAIVASAAAVGQALAGLSAVLDPELIIVAGGVADIGPLWWQAMESAVAETAPANLSSAPVRPGELGSRSALLGAAAAAWDGELR